ncbi:MAG: sodium-translocating pyrophosphatase [Planctomycetota bacterium]
MVPTVWFTATAAALIALFWAKRFFSEMKVADEGTDQMRSIAQSVRDGADAYLRQQNRWVAVVFVVVASLLAVAAYGGNLVHPLSPWAFLMGGIFSGLCGWFGMKTATAASSRTAAAARESLDSGLKIAFRSGAVMGLIVVGMGMLFICFWFAVLYWIIPIAGGQESTPAEISVAMLSFGMGASAQALFARVGGGIFTKAADVGADLVGKVEESLKEDSPRNPATIADNVGDNVGDVAGMGADLYESYCGSILAASALGVAAVSNPSLLGEGVDPVASSLRAMMLPLAIAAVGILLSIVGMYAVRTSSDDLSGKSLLAALNRGINLSTLLTAVAAILICIIVMPKIESAIYFGFLPGISLAVVIGLVSGWAIGWWTERVTSDEYKTTQRLAAQAETGPATVIIGGVADGMLSTWMPVVIVCLGMFAAFKAAAGTGDPSDTFALGLYGVGIAAVGMLSTLGITLATDAYGPIADNAGGNAEMAGLEDYVRERTDALDSLGNTTAATGKGFAIGSAALTALALLAAYVESVRDGYLRWGREVAATTEAGQRVEFSPGLIVDTTGDAAQILMQLPNVSEKLGSKATLHDFLAFYDASLMNPRVLIGLFLGAMAANVFCALTMKSVGRAAQGMVQEVRRQFQANPGILEGTVKPDYAGPVKISTLAAQKEMILPSLLGLILPIVVGLSFGVAGVLGLLAGCLTSGFCLAVFMANSGGAWDNAKKYIEAGNHGGKGGQPHKAAVVGDTVGDPFKDTSGPSLNILIKLMSMVSVVAAGLVIRYAF